jgi:Phosphodiester glycosidase
VAAELRLSTGSGRHGTPRPRRRRDWKPHFPRRRWSRITAAVLIVVLVPVGWSVGHALTMTGGGPVSQRLAEWARDHYLGPLVTLGEWITYQPPKVGGKPAFALTGPSAAASKVPNHIRSSAPVYPPPANLQPVVSPALPDEGVWRVLGTVNGQGAVYGTEMRASSVYSSYVAGIVSMNQNLVRFELHPGAEDPGPGNWNSPDYLPLGSRTGLLATFNSGFKIASSGGGFYLNGATAGTLTAGVASVVYYADGHIAIGNWDSDPGISMSPNVVGVRQNLHLIVQNGQVPSTVDQNVESSWGATLGGGYYVWRSGIGITADNRVIFVYGPSLDVRELADLMQQAGAVTGMELDINPEWTDFMYYLPGAPPAPETLLPDQQQPADRYYSPASRDFTAVYAK